VNIPFFIAQIFSSLVSAGLVSAGLVWGVMLIIVSMVSKGSTASAPKPFHMLALFTAVALFSMLWGIYG
jgi:hypothetical protein